MWEIIFHKHETYVSLLESIIFHKYETYISLLESTIFHEYETYVSLLESQYEKLHFAMTALFIASMP